MWQNLQKLAEITLIKKKTLDGYHVLANTVSGIFSHKQIEKCKTVSMGEIEARKYSNEPIIWRVGWFCI